MFNSDLGTFNENHPECKAGEYFQGNFLRQRATELLSEHPGIMRIGEAAYDDYGKPLSSIYVPVFRNATWLKK